MLGNHRCLLLTDFVEKVSSCDAGISVIQSVQLAGLKVMRGDRQVEQAALFYEFSLEKHIPADHLLRSIDKFVDFHEIKRDLAPFYSNIGRPSIDPELIIQMLLIGYCFGIRSERRLCDEVHLNLAYRWFCRLSLDAAVPDHSTFSKNRHGRRVPRSIYEGARDMARQIARSWEGRTSRRLRKKIEMLFAHLKRILKLDRLRLRGPNGARDEFTLAATAQNLRKMAKLIPMPTPRLA